ncbi:MAG: N-formylglutamate amidohydrolase, partial [Pseudomonadota bacterium]
MRPPTAILKSMQENEAYHLWRPAQTQSAAVFSSPHSGREYPDDLIARARLNRLELRSSEDAFVDTLFRPAVDWGAPLIAAKAPRAYVDLNRGPEELDPAVVSGVRATGLNPRVAAGLGVVPRIVAEGRPIYTGKISRVEAEGRIDRWHRPYHTALLGLLDEAASAFGYVVLFDCHSMPRDALRAAPRVRGARADIVLGDRFGASAGRDIMAAARAAFEDAGFVVACNAPFAGGHITQKYGLPSRGRHAIQVEIDRGLYLDGSRMTPSAGYDGFADALAGVIPAL